MHMAVHGGVEIHPLKETVPGLYVTAREAYEAWKADPEQVIILDVRAFEEVLFVGFATMAWKIPLTIQTTEWDAAKSMFQMTPLPDFVARVKQVATPEHTIMAMCRSGGRSAMALNVLAGAGFTKLYNIIDGMEGDLVDDPASAFVGQRLKNGWKNAGCPWTYTLTPDRLLLPAIAKKE
jgi:rhodanese-related sulfurtransferase